MSATPRGAPEMSGVLGSAVDIVSSFEGGLIDAELAGLSFIMVDHREAPGRRALRWLFPGHDVAQFADLGADQGVMAISGFYCGDDYVEQLAAFRKAFATAGPQTLVHPWLGTVQVVICPGGSLSLRQDGLGMLRLEFRCWPYTAAAPAQPDTLQTVLDEIGVVRNAVGNYLSDVLTVQQEISGAVGYVTGFCGQLQGSWTALALVLGTDPSAAALAAPVAALGTAASLAPGTGYPAAVAGLLSAPSAALSNAANPPLPAAIAPGSPPSAPPASNPLVVAACLVAAGPAIAALVQPASATPAPALVAASEAFVACDAANVVTDIPFTSQQDASYWLSQALGQIDLAAGLVAAQAAANPLTASVLWQALMEMRTALSNDFTVLLGRLPAVETLVLPAQQTNLWLVAQYLAGDDPSQVVGMLLDVRQRNDVLNPALVAGSLEVLQ